ncbi:hypothetical protein HUE87_09265 [Candidatus Sulfurimonas marisnigri]|uniref:Oligosaccharide repeat unit polymerase n=1 Tax=Candidatus Sulfurimonas marisnigri TaxID=2740405 RepID=A0A7S7LZC8_9BACT|nr:hypothetical protein [Candidatus Sulfurimonas marisnigri]QOY54065.1 hypothetical protein HUE87_09265 [Candidatus Sulfurimonas marisnigri]
MRIKNTYDLNSILTFINFLISICICYAFSFVDNNPYINHWTLVLGIILSIQTHIVLLIEKGSKDPFVIIFTFFIIFYYSLRVFTLSLYPESHVFDRYEYDASDSNFTMIFIIISNMFLYFGFFLIKVKKHFLDKRKEINTKSPSLYIYVFMFLILIINIFSEKFSGSLGVLFFLFNPQIGFIFVLIYFMTYKEKISSFLRICIFLFILSLILFLILSGSRSGIVTFIEILMAVLLAVNNNIKFLKKKVYMVFLFSPIIVVMLFFSYSLATTNRATGSSTANFNDKLTYASSMDLGMDGSKIEYFIAHICGRIGFFDFSSEIIAHREKYIDIFNLSTYGKSIIDNILTPGFDLFDQPKIANSLVFVYNDYGNPLKSNVASMYQSDQLGIHGELYVLFGYNSVWLFFLMAYFLKYVYNRIPSNNLFNIYLYKFFILFLFISMIKDFGLDWIILYNLLLLVSLYINSLFFRYRFKFYSKN